MVHLSIQLHIPEITPLTTVSLFISMTISATTKPKLLKPYKRNQLGTSNEVACWQNGGLWVTTLHPLEMRAIGLNRFQDNERSLNKTEEDAFCALLRTYGADFYAVPPRWRGSTLWSSFPVPSAWPDIKVTLSTCFPGDGSVWVLNGKNWDRRLENAVTMAERCSLFEEPKTNRSFPFPSSSDLFSWFEGKGAATQSWYPEENKVRK